MTTVSARVVIAGDLVLGGINEEPARRGLLAESCSGVTERIAAADVVVANLEAPLCADGIGIAKLGPCLRVDPAAARGITDLGIGVVNLANNHIMDFGPRGLAETIEVCDRLGLGRFGAGQDAESASQIAIREVGGLRIGFLGLAEHEFSLALAGAPGANPIDPIGVVEAIEGLDGLVDHLIVLVHGGLEHYPYPTPRLRRFAKFLVRQGASAVVCQHTHIIGCWERFEGRPIVYGQGNFLFDYPTRKDSWWSGLLVEIELSGDEVDVDFVPHRMESGVPGVRLTNPAESDQILADFTARSANLHDRDLLAREFQHFVDDHANWYMGLYEAVPRWLRKLDHRFGVLSLMRDRRGSTMRYGVVACESHREVLLEILGRHGDLYQYRDSR